jgi:hypothetical protein
VRQQAQSPQGQPVAAEQQLAFVGQVSHATQHGQSSQGQTPVSQQSQPAGQHGQQPAADPAADPG